MRRVLVARRLAMTTVIACGTLLTGIGGTGARAAAPGGVLATIRVGNGPDAIAVDARLGHAFVLKNMRYSAGAVSMLDTRSGAVLRTVDVDQGPQAIAVDQQTNRIFVSALGSAGSVNNGSISVLDARTGNLLRTIPVPHPTAMALDARTHRLFVLDTAGAAPTGGVLIFDTRGGALLRALHMGGFPFAIAVDQRANRVFVVNFANGSVSVLDARTGSRLRTTQLGASWPRSGDAATAIAVDERSGRVFITTLQSANAYMLDARTGTLLRTFAVGQNPLAIAVDGRGGRVLITTEGAVDQFDNPVQRGAVYVFAVATGALIGVARAGTYPAAVAIDGATGRAFIFNMADASVSVIDTHTTTVLSTLAIKATRIAGIDPLQQALAVDEETGHAFAVNLGGAHVTMLDAR